MARQERTARRNQRASTEARHIIEEAKAKATSDPANAQRHRLEGALAAAKAERKVRCRECSGTGPSGAVAHKPACSRYGQSPATATRAPLAGVRTVKTSSSGTVGSEADVAAEVRRLRDEEGLSWVQVGAKLGLPGAKSGAASARKLYASTGADYRSTVVKKTARPAPPRREPKAKAPSKTEVKKRVQGGEHLIPLDTPDAEVVAMLRNRQIRWSINVADLCDGKGGEAVFSEQEATVHPDGLRVDRGEDGSYEPYVHFREMHATREGPVAANFRTVRLSSIHDVR